MACFMYDLKCDVIIDVEIENEAKQNETKMKKNRFFAIFPKQFPTLQKNIYMYARINWKMVYML